MRRSKLSVLVKRLNELKSKEKSDFAVDTAFLREREREQER